MIIPNERGFLVKGEIGFHNVLQLRAQGEALISAFHENCEIDLKDVREKDASIFSLLLCWQRFAKKNHCELHFINAPDVLQRMSTLFSLTHLLKISNG